MISCEMEDTMLYQDIPRIYTAIAEWGACLVYLYILKKEILYFSKYQIRLCLTLLLLKELMN